MFCIRVGCITFTHCRKTDLVVDTTVKLCASLLTLLTNFDIEGVVSVDLLHQAKGLRSCCSTHPNIVKFLETDQTDSPWSPDDGLCPLIPIRYGYLAKMGLVHEVKGIVQGMFLFLHINHTIAATNDDHLSDRESIVFHKVVVNALAPGIRNGLLGR